jgi:hypothetical protein
MNVHRTFLMAAAVLVFALVPSAQATMANAVPNPGFEELGCGSGSSVLPDICAWHAGYGSIIGRDPMKPHSGSASLALVGFSGAAEAMSDPAYCMPIGPGRRAASFWYRTPYTGSPDGMNTGIPEGNVAFLGFSVRFWPSPKCSGSGSSSEQLIEYPPILDNQWHQVSGDVVAPAGTASVSFGLAIRAACDLCFAVSAEFDDLVLDREPLPVPTAEKSG